MKSWNKFFLGSPKEIVRFPTALYSSPLQRQIEIYIKYWDNMMVWSKLAGNIPLRELEGFLYDLNGNLN
jgi:hypothetical protein